MKALIVEDDSHIAEGILRGLESEGFESDHAEDGEEAFFRLSTNRYDIVILDVMLPGRSGLEILKAIRERTDETPVLILSARDGVDDRVIGLDAGADDYLVKPFALAELIARIRTLLRRTNYEKEHVLRLADLELDRIRRKVTRSDRPIELTPREFDLLEFFFLNRGRIVSREMLAKNVWKETQRVTPLDNIIDVHVGRLRKKIDSQFGKKLIQTIRGVGFSLRESP